MKLKKLLMVLLVTGIFIALGIVATAEIDPHPWSIQPGSTINLLK